MHGLTLPALIATLSLAVAPVAQAQSAPPAAAKGAAPKPAAPGVPPAAASADPVIAKVGPDEIHASELSDAAQGLPEQLRGMPPQMLYPMLLDQLIDRRAIVLAGRKEGLANDPAIKRAAARATDTAIQNLLLTRAIAPTLTEDAIKARYDQEYAGKAGEEEVHAAHILVPDEAKAKEVIAELKAGKDFAELAKENSTDPSAKTNNGDLGFFKKTDMLPEFADVGSGARPDPPAVDPGRRRQGPGQREARPADREVQPGRHAPQRHRRPGPHAPAERGTCTRAYEIGPWR